MALNLQIYPIFLKFVELFELSIEKNYFKPCELFTKINYTNLKF